MDKLKLFFLPLKQAPGREQVEELVQWVAHLERPYRVRKVSEYWKRYGPRELEEILESLNNSEHYGLWIVEGGYVGRSYVKHYKAPSTSVFMAAAIHGERSLYAFGFSRPTVESNGYAPDLRREFARRLSSIPEVKRELWAVHHRQAAQRGVQGVVEAGPFVNWQSRGHVTFLAPFPGFLTEYVLVGRLLLPLKWLRQGDLLELKEDALARYLRDATGLTGVPPRVWRALLRGEGTPEEAEALIRRVRTLEGLSRL